MEIEEREKYLNELREICQEIGCSGIDPDMCYRRPYRCDIIRKAVMAHQPPATSDGESGADTEFICTHGYTAGKCPYCLY